MNRPGISAVTCCLWVIFCGTGLAEERAKRPPPAPTMLERPGMAEFKEPSIEPGREIAAVQMAWVQEETRTVAQRLQGAIRTLIGKESAGRLARQLAYEDLAALVAGEAAGGWARLADTAILVRYDARFDELRVLDEETDVIEDAARDVGIEGARDVAERTLAQLAETGVIDPRLYRQAAVQIGYKVVGEGPVDQKLMPGRIVGYRVTYRPRVRGFQLANAGVRLGINASGAVASLRVGGVTPQGKWRGDALEPSGAGGVRKVRVTTKELMERFYRQVPKGVEPRVAWSRVMYVMPESTRSAVLEPMLVISATQVRQTGDGPIASRRRTLAYSLTDAKAPPIDFDASAPQHEGIELVRKR